MGENLWKYLNKIEVIIIIIRRIIMIINKFENDIENNVWKWKFKKCKNII